MMRTHTTTILLALAALLPQVAAAQVYLEPEDVLYLHAQRVRPRNAEEVVAEQQTRATEQATPRPTVTEWWTKSSSSASSAASVAAPAQTVETHPAAADDGGEEDIDLITARILRRLQRENQGEPVLHEGANLLPVYKPANLYHTGPESVLAALAMLPAGVFVILRARKLEKFVRA